MNSARRSSTEPERAPRQSTGRVVVPNFIIIGAMKCGTTSLFRHLGRHPEIGLSRQKETDFFLAESNFARGFEWYSALFPTGARIYGEASPNYTKCNEFPGVAERIFRNVPDAKLIYMVRDPVERFVSQYSHHLNAGEIDIPPERILNSRAGRHYLDCSRYYRQVSEYLRFFPREQLLIVELNDLREDPRQLLERVYSFLDVDAQVPMDGLTEAHNRGNDLQRMPSWYFAARRSPLLREVKRRLPIGVQDALVAQITRGSRLARGSQRRVPEIGEELREAVKPLLAEDAACFRQFTGRTFDHWSV